MTEQHEYEVVETFRDAELRRYSRCTIAEITLTGSAESVGNRAFGPLVRYISAERLAMTAPVRQVAADIEGRWKVSFVLPGGKGLNDYPIPDNADVTLRELPEHYAMATRWSGRWKYADVEKRTAILRAVNAAQGMNETGDPVWARYDPPWKPWFARRNEVLIEVELPRAH